MTARATTRLGSQVLQEAILREFGCPDGVQSARALEALAKLGAFVASLPTLGALTMMTGKDDHRTGWKHH